MFSPRKTFVIFSRVEKDVGEVVILADKLGNKLQVAKTERWGEIKWSPVETRFAYVDHCDGQASSLYIFEIRYRIDKSLYVEELYHSPQMGSLGVEWNVVSWQSNGTEVRIKRSVVMKLDSGSDRLGDQTFNLPLE